MLRFSPQFFTAEVQLDGSLVDAPPDHAQEEYDDSHGEVAQQLEGVWEAHPQDATGAVQGP